MWFWYWVFEVEDIGLGNLVVEVVFLFCCLCVGFGCDDVNDNDSSDDDGEDEDDDDVYDNEDIGKNDEENVLILLFVEEKFEKVLYLICESGFFEMENNKIIFLDDGNMFVEIRVWCFVKVCVFCLFLVNVVEMNCKVVECFCSVGLVFVVMILVMGEVVFFMFVFNCFRFVFCIWRYDVVFKMCILEVFGDVFKRECIGIVFDVI